MKTQLVQVLAVLGFAAICIISCSKSNNNQTTTTPPPVTCDSVNMKYSTDIVPILQANCYLCHGKGSTAGSAGILLEGYTNIQPFVASGTVKGVVTHASGYIGMPYEKAKLDSCTINKILDWIAQGAPNN
jgi:hypothetical protein